MSPLSLDAAARQVLDRYPLLLPGRSLLALGNRGGFSGARLWRIEGPAGDVCLRAWPPNEATPERLSDIHRLMITARKYGLHFVPAVFVTGAGATWVEHASRLWDVTTWLPGRADFHECPSGARLEAALEALAQLHAVWASMQPAAGPCPAIRRRLESFRDWTALIQSGWQPAFAPSDLDPVRPWAERLAEPVAAHRAGASPAGAVGRSQLAAAALPV